MKKYMKKLKIILPVLLVIIVILVVMIVNINKDSRIKESTYKTANGESVSTFLAEYIREGITIGGVEGTLKVLDTSDATASAKDIEWGRTAYVNGEKITGTMLTSNKVSYLKGKDVYFDENKEVIDDLENKIILPKGFKISEESAVLVEDGIVIEDRNKNQFVWIPAGINGVNINTTTGIKNVKYERIDFGIQFGGKPTWDENANYGYYESMPEDERSSIEKYYGYYIGRFDAGDKEVTNEKRMRNENDSINNTVTIKKGDAPYNYVLKKDAVSLSEGMAQEEGYDTKTKLCSSFAWDTAINFIQIKTSDYGTNSPQGNYKDTTFNYANIGETEKMQTKTNGSTILVPNGQTTPVSNIYDMSGNMFKFISEIYHMDGDTWEPVYRGGNSQALVDDRPVGYRAYRDRDNIKDEFWRF